MPHQQLGDFTPFSLGGRQQYRRLAIQVIADRIVHHEFQWSALNISFTIAKERSAKASAERPRSR